MMKSFNKDFKHHDPRRLTGTERGILIAVLVSGATTLLTVSVIWWVIL